MKIRQLLILLLITLLWLSGSSCGRHRLRPGEIERNGFFAEILRREDYRILGEDDFFKKNLTGSPHPEVRRWCAIAVGRIGNPRALPWLYDALGSRDAAVRAASAFAIGEIEDRAVLKAEGRHADCRAIPELRRALFDPSRQVAMRAIEALGKIGSHSEAVEIVRLLDNFPSDTSPLSRAYLDLAVTALIRLEDPVAFPTLEKLAENSDFEIQWRAVNALSRLGDKAARPIFLRLLDSPSDMVRAYAARGLGICGDPSLAGCLHPLLPPRHPTSDRAAPLFVRVSALQALGKLKKPDSIQVIQAALGAGPISEENPDSMNFAIQAASALGEIEAPAARDALIPLLRATGPAADAAVIALARRAKEEPERFFDLVRLDAFGSPPAIRALAQALGELGGQRAVRELKALLLGFLGENAGPNATLVVPAILSALAKAEAPDLDEVLKPFLTTRDGVVLRAAVAAYKTNPEHRSPWAPILRAYAGIAADADLEAKVEILNRLEPWTQQGDVQAALRSALQDRQRNVRIAAARLLRMAGAAYVPDDPGPAESSKSVNTYAHLAGARKDRTIAIMETTRGTIEIELFREDAPLTVDNFVLLAKRGFFDGLNFMRVVPFFVIQGGDPRNDQEGGPGYTIRCEINMHPFERGSVGMALAGKDTGGSQFFIALSPQPHLDGSYTCFGRVISAMTVADRITPGDRILRVRIYEDVTALDYRRF